MAARGAAITLQAGIGLTCKAVASGHRMVAVACRGTEGLPGGDTPLDPEKANLSDQQLKSVAERTLWMVDQLRPPTKGLPLVGSVKLELGMLRDECEGLVEELGAAKFSDRTAASITLLGLHSRVAILLELFYGRHGSLEESTKKSLQDSMTRTEVCLEEHGVREPTGAKVAEAVETSLPKLLEILANKTRILLEVTEYQLCKDRTRTPERLSVSMELKELGGRCNQLIKKIKVRGIADHVAVGTLLGLHARFRMVFLFCVRDADDSSRPDCLETSVSAGIATSITGMEQRVKDYMEKEDKYE